jgi:hypothetical protein
MPRLKKSHNFLEFSKSNIFYKLTIFFKLFFNNKKSLKISAIAKVFNLLFFWLYNLKIFLKKLATVFLLVCFVFQQFIFVFSATALAIDLPITPDGTTNTNIDTASNGVAIVNIAPQMLADFLIINLKIIM